MLLLCFLTNKRCHMLVVDLLLFMYSIFLMLTQLWVLFRGGDGINFSFLYLLSLDQVLFPFLLSLQAGLWLWDTQVPFLLSSLQSGLQLCPPWKQLLSQHPEICVGVCFSPFVHLSLFLGLVSCILQHKVLLSELLTAYVPQPCFTPYWYCCNCRDSFFILCFQYIFS